MNASATSSRPATKPLAPAPAVDPPVAVSGTRRLAWVRHGVQLTLLALMLTPLWWPWLSQAAPFFRGNLAASRINLGPLAIPLADPFTTLSILCSARQLPATLIAGAGLVLGFYLVVRPRAFCAWACPLHLVLEGGDWLLGKLRVRRERIGARWPRWTSALIAFALLAAATAAGLPVWEPVNPINALLRSLQSLSFAGAWLVGTALILDSLAGRRAFCRHLCPVGGFYSTVNRAGLAGVAIDTGACTHCRACTHTCLAAPELESAIQRARPPQPRTWIPVESPHCTVCLDCVTVCAHAGIRLRRRHRAMAPPPAEPTPS